MYGKESGGGSVERKVKCTEKKSKRGMYKKDNRQRRWRLEKDIYGKEGGRN